MLTHRGIFHSRYIRFKIKWLALKVFYWLENNNNADFHSNGEEHFINAISCHFHDLGNQQLEILDVGANRGGYTQMLLESLSKNGIKARINLFEPTASCCRLLAERYSSDANVALNQVAVSNANETVQIYFDREQSALASLYQRNLSAQGISLSHTEAVRTIRLDDYIKANEITHIHLLKMDIEGHEIPALEGLGEYLTGDFIDFIQFEYGGANLDSKTSLMDLYALLEKRGFALAKVMVNGLEIRKYQAWMDNFAYSNYVAISEKVLDSIR